MQKKKKKNSQESRRKTTKRNSSILEYEIFRMIESSLKSAINTAMDDIFKEW